MNAYLVHLSGGGEGGGTCSVTILLLIVLVHERFERRKREELGGKCKDTFMGGMEKIGVIACRA